MKFMVKWKCHPGLYKTAVQQFLKTEGKPPKGLKTVGRWHVPGSNLGWHLLGRRSGCSGRARCGVGKRD